MNAPRFGLLLCAAAVVWSAAPARADWYCSGQRLWNAPKEDTGVVLVYNTKGQWIGQRRVTTCEVNACASAQRVGSFVPEEPLSSPVTGTIKARAHKNHLCEVYLDWAPPPARPNSKKPSTWTQQTWNRNAKWHHHFADNSPFDSFSAAWESQSFAADRYFSGIARSHKDEGSGDPWKDRTGILLSLNGQPVALSITQHTVAWVEAYVEIEASLAGGYVCACTRTYATDWGSQCSGCP